jgi:glycosyltransferase involved in cell wall biosynthesis
VFRSLIGPFERFDDVDLVGGTYIGPRAANRFIVDFRYADLHQFLPSGRCAAVRRSIAVDHPFPEYLTLTGEDTWFGLNYRRRSNRWVINRAATVTWHGPETTAQADALERSYGRGDGESGFGDARYYRKLYGHEVTSPEDHGFEGYLEGRARRAEIEVARRGVTSVTVILAGVPFTDSGGGQRGTQLAIETIRQGGKVIFVNIYPSYEEHQELWFDIDYSLLELVTLTDFSIGSIIDRYGPLDVPINLILEFPHPGFLTIVDEFRARNGNGSVVFDYIDNWDTSLGGEWYTIETERDIIEKSDVLIASAASLQSSLVEKSGRETHLVPNALNSQLFGPHQWDLPRPSNMPMAQTIVTYVGALWGSWFDWPTFLSWVTSRPQIAFVLIGHITDERRAELEHFPNVSVLGLQPQNALPAYLAHSTCCVIPFTVDDVTEFVNPLKVYEYLAMGRPVLASNMSELRGLEGVTLYDDPHTSVELLDVVSSQTIDAANVERLVEAHSWTERLQRLRAAVECRSPVVSQRTD